MEIVEDAEPTDEVQQGDLAISPYIANQKMTLRQRTVRETTKVRWSRMLIDVFGKIKLSFDLNIVSMSEGAITWKAGNRTFPTPVSERTNSSLMTQHLQNEMSECDFASRFYDNYSALTMLIRHPAFTLLWASSGRGRPPEAV